MSKQGKKYRAARAAIAADRFYTVAEAVAELKKLVYAKFNESVELILRLGIDPRHSDQMVRGTVSLPHGTGKTVRVVAFCSAEKVAEALAAGADFAGSSDLVEKIKAGWTDFDIAVAEKGVMREISPLGKILGPRGLMPSPKAGTVTDDISAAIGEVKAGRIEFKCDKNGNIQVAVGKVSFEAPALVENVLSVAREIVRVRPAAVKGKYLVKGYICSTMSPAFKLDVTELAGG